MRVCVCCALGLCVVLTRVCCGRCPFAACRLPQVYYKDAFGALLVFDVSRPETFASVKSVRTPVLVACRCARLPPHAQSLSRADV